MFILSRGTLIRFVFFAVFLISACVSPVAARAEGWLEFFIPALRNRIDEPSRTLTAPFAEQATKSAAPLPTATSIPELPENKVPLDQAHRTTEQIGEWLTMAVSEALTFQKADYKDSLNASLRHFDESGKAQYMAFLDENGIVKILESNRFYISGFTQSMPLLLNEGVVDGRFRWLYEVPVMITYLDRAATKGYKEAQPVNQNMSLTIQVGRTSDLSAGKDVAIERWTGKVQNITKK